VIFDRNSGSLLTQPGDNGLGELNDLSVDFLIHFANCLGKTAIRPDTFSPRNISDAEISLRMAQLLSSVNV